jgi:hypothetical protein
MTPKKPPNRNMESDDVFHRELRVKLKNNNIHYLFMGFYTPWMGGIPRRGSREKIEWRHLGGDLAHTDSICK